MLKQQLITETGQVMSISLALWQKDFCKLLKLTLKTKVYIPINLKLVKVGPTWNLFWMSHDHFKGKDIWNILQFLINWQIFKVMYKNKLIGRINLINFDAWKDSWCCMAIVEFAVCIRNASIRKWLHKKLIRFECKSWIWNLLLTWRHWNSWGWLSSMWACMYACVCVSITKNEPEIDWNLKKWLFNIEIMKRSR